MNATNYFYKALLLTILAGAMAACDNLEQTVTLDLNQTESRVVIDGLIINEPTTQYVMLSRVGDFYGQGETLPISDASVLVSDDAGNNYTFLESEDSAGLYTFDFEGIVGRTYRLEVNIDGVLYEADEFLAPITEIDSLKWELNEEEQEDPADEGLFYEVLLYTNEPQETKDFYLFQFYRNDTLLNNNFEEAYFTDDEFLGERIDGISTGYFFAMGDTATVEVMSISQKAFVYYNDLITALNNDGGMFSPIPANLRNNLSNGAVGYFRASAVSRETIVIGED